MSTQSSDHPLVKVPARFYDGLQPIGREVHLEVRGTYAGVPTLWVSAEPEGVLFDSHLREWETDDFASRVVHLRHRHSDRIIEVRLEDAISLFGRKGRPFSQRKRVAIYAGLLMALAGAVWTGAPVLSVTLAQKVPIEWETLLSRKLLSTLEPELCREPDVQAALAVLVEPLIHGEPLPYVPVIRVIRDPAVNAFALPGGLIVLNTGLLAKIKSHEALQGVIAHELQHVLHRHVLAALIRGSLFTAFWAVTVGDYSGMLAMDPASVYQLATLRFSRDAETEADAAAIQMLVRAGISSEPFEEFLAKDLSGLTGLSFLSTHLLGEERRVAAKQKSQSDPNGVLPPAGAGKSTSGSSGAEAWTLLQSACQSLKQGGSHE